jgi:hypothetical protein
LGIRRTDIQGGDEPARTTEVVRPALPDLLRLNRYERRAASRGARAIRRLMQSGD